MKPGNLLCAARCQFLRLRPADEITLKFPAGRPGISFPVFI